MNPEDLATNFLSILQDGNFLLEISKKQSIDEVREEFSKKGCDLTNEQAEFIQEKVKGILSGKIKMTEQDLEDVSGGRNVNFEKVLIVVMGIALAISVGALAGSSFKSSAPPPENQKVNGLFDSICKLFSRPEAKVFAEEIVDGVEYANRQSWFARGINAITCGWLFKPTPFQTGSRVISRAIKRLDE